MCNRAFTLLELLITVAIIAILAVIAVLNFNEARTRAQIARAKSDMNVVATALESYAIDYRVYPYPRLGRRPGPDNDFNGLLARVVELTTPVSYLQSVKLFDPFKPTWKAYTDAPIPPSIIDQPTYTYDNYSGWFLTTLPPEVQKEATPFTGYCLSSTGPDRKFDGGNWIPMILDNPNFKPKLLQMLIGGVYDPTNGTSSRGDIIRYNGKPRKLGEF